ncbi:hypothetical protein RhiirC2_797847 [Rhizophagus irregularis]|uniref:Uncharacterized protein n=1 Tax=Rhizophagus irregularis TaxID=588596 RepID=A0A2N1M7D6_9GLOM|nr:hypothetical protein RhiirC2_797847 [Rhizophagus irregularis]
MPVDPKGFHYFLVVVEVAGKRIDAEPLKDKTANRILNGFVKIYRRNRIKPPTHRLETDSGSEFTNDQLSKPFKNPFQTNGCTGVEDWVISVEWSEDFCDVVSKVDELWQRNPPDIPTESPKVSKKTDLLSEGTRVRVKLDEPISVLDTKATWEPADQLEEDVPDLIRKFWE